MGPSLVSTLVSVACTTRSLNAEHLEQDAVALTAWAQGYVQQGWSQAVGDSVNVPVSPGTPGLDLSVSVTQDYDREYAS